MNRADAKRRVDEGITRGELIEILKNARQSITDWTQASIINPSLSKGACFNIMWKGMPDNEDSCGFGIIAKNILREFGGKGYPRKKRGAVKVSHQEPIEIELEK